VNASCFGFAGGVKTCLWAGFAGFFAGFAGGTNGAVVVTAVVVPATAVVVVVAAVVVSAVVVVPGGVGFVPAGFVVVVPPQSEHVVVVVLMVVVVVGTVVVVAHVLLPLSLPLLPLLPDWFWSQLPTPPPFATQFDEPAGSPCVPGGHTLPGPVGCAFGLDGWARATADATPAAITMASTAPMAIGRNRRILCLKLVPFYGLRILELIVGASRPVSDPPTGYFHPSLRLVLPGTVVPDGDRGRALCPSGPQSRKTS
jgi:hypothetical protein